MSAFIPFCQFGTDWIGTKIDRFDVPICNIFQVKVLEFGLCYEVDPNQFKNFLSFDDYYQGITLYVDINLDRQTFEPENDFTIHLHTIGKS